jgi:hypothetical protein
MGSSQQFKKQLRERRARLKAIPQIDPTEQAAKTTETPDSQTVPEQDTATPPPERVEAAPTVPSSDDELVKLTTRVKWRNFRGIKTLAVETRRNDYDIVDAALEAYLRRQGRL